MPKLLLRRAFPVSVVALVAIVAAGCAREAAAPGETQPRVGTGRSDSTTDEPLQRAPAGTRYTAFVALEGASAVAVLRGPPWRLVRRVRVPAGPHNVRASHDGRFVAVSSPPADRVTIFRASGRVAARAPGYRALPTTSPSPATETASGSRPSAPVDSSRSRFRPGAS